MIKAVIFDLDGTLMDTLAGIACHGNTALASLGLPPVSLDKYKVFIGNGRANLLHRCLAYHNADTEENFNKAVEIFDNSYFNECTKNSVVYDGIYELLSSLKADGIKLCVLSNKPHKITTRTIEKIFPDTFDIFYGQRDDFPKKPNPDVAWNIADSLGVKYEECAFVGDSDVDIITGNNAKMYSIGASWGFRGREELLGAGAKSVADTPNDIYETIKNLK